MTTQARYRCRHCLIPYTYYPSGYNSIYNNEDYCPDCQKIILDALENVPKRVERFSKPYDGISIDELKEIVKNQKPQLFRRVAVPSFDLKDPKNQNISGFANIDGFEIYYSYWTNSSKYRIEIDMERNLETGEEHPWEDIINRYD